VVELPEDESSEDEGKDVAMEEGTSVEIITGDVAVGRVAELTETVLREVESALVELGGVPVMAEPVMGIGVLIRLVLSIALDEEADADAVRVLPALIVNLGLALPESPITNNFKVNQVHN